MVVHLNNPHTISPNATLGMKLECRSTIAFISLSHTEADAKRLFPLRSASGELNDSPVRPWLQVQMFLGAYSELSFIRAIRGCVLSPCDWLLCNEVKRNSPG